MEEMRSVDDVVHLTEESFNMMDSQGLEDKLISFQLYMEASYSKEGGNDCKEPHASKKKLRKRGIIIDKITSDAQVYDCARSKLGL